ncbi:prealbumin-like fold domain-containing protein [Antribacter sp. KLBMP9083]|uniref:Prealbumin-like fold domain-containing protein n=2 Tax=Antribacter soli TaxID=2910976 RepID=A0AA41U6V5_9MICO|nr:prealbumin-like fold domain-containing protein [Antribacter soli]
MVTQALSASASHPVATLAGSNFEIDIDANLKVDDAGADDWASVNFAVADDEPTGRNDDSFSGGAKEDDTCPTTTTGSIPNNKSDLLDFGVYEEEGDPGFLHLFWSRVQDPSGTTLMDFELNQSGTDCGNGVNKVRTVGDLLLEYRLDQGGATAQILAREWTGTAWGGATDLTQIGQATGTINSSAIPDAESAGLGPLDPRTFGEASVDLDFLFGETGECVSFGSAFLKSRSSTSFTSQLKDFIKPITVDISNCGSITINKVTDPPGAAGSFGYTTTGGLDPATFSLLSGGSQAYTGVLAGTYTVTENADAPGELVSIVCTGGTTSVSGRTATINLAADDNVVCTFTNRLSGSILVHKVDDNGQPLAGAGFTASPGAIVLTEVSTGVFCANVPFGTYTVTETTVPPGYTGGAPQNVTVNTASTCADRTGGVPDLTFTNAQLHKVIVLVCHEATGELVASQVTAGATTLTTIVDAPAGTTEAALCGIAGFGGLPHGAFGLSSTYPH